jgi:hypothetical protein
MGDAQVIQDFVWADNPRIGTILVCFGSARGAFGSSKWTCPVVHVFSRGEGNGSWSNHDLDFLCLFGVLGNRLR